MSTVLYERRGAVAVLTINRPQAMNAYDASAVEAMGRYFAEFDQDPDLRVAILTGAGEKAFCTGADLKSLHGAAFGGGAAELWDDQRQYRLGQRINPRKPVIGAINGYCLAGAFELALACDVTVAGEGTKFGEPEVRFGSGIVAMLLPWVTGPKQAKELLLTGDDKLTAARMLEIGVVNRVVPDGEVLDSALALARAFASAAPDSVRMTKRAINRTYEIMGLRQALLASLETDILIEADENPDRAEFNRIRNEQGLAAALAWRNSR